MFRLVATGLATLSFAFVLTMAAEVRAQTEDENAQLIATATQLWQAMRDCDVARLHRTLLTRTEFASYTTKEAPDEATYQGLVDDWEEAMVKPFCDAPKAGFAFRLGQPRIKQIVNKPAGGKTKRPITIAFVTTRIFLDSGSLHDSEGRESEPVMLVNHEGQWRVLVHK